MFCVTDSVGISENSWKMTAMPSLNASSRDSISTGFPSKTISPPSFG